MEKYEQYSKEKIITSKDTRTLERVVNIMNTEDTNEFAAEVLHGELNGNEIDFKPERLNKEDIMKLYESPELLRSP